MVATHCTKCYRVKQLLPATQEMQDVLVCERCRYDIEEVFGFVHYAGYTLSLQGNSPDSKSPEPTKKPVKRD